ncbi:MAG: hypothetical protein HOP29_03455 [Phycisphaerales bacterium]|nr:hypothetical protein [Phycisphaerales bacterium]
MSAHMSWSTGMSPRGPEDHTTGVHPNPPRYLANFALRCTAVPPQGGNALVIIKTRRGRRGSLSDDGRTHDDAVRHAGGGSDDGRGFITSDTFAPTGFEGQEADGGESNPIGLSESRVEGLIVPA